MDANPIERLSLLQERTLRQNGLDSHRSSAVLGMRSLARSGWFFHARPQRHCSVANERPKLHANIRSPCGPEPQASFHKLRLAVCNNLQPLSDSSTEALDGLQKGSCVTMPGLSLFWQHWSKPLQRNCIALRIYPASTTQS